MPLTVWRKLFHKCLVVNGFMALIAIMSNTDINRGPIDLGLIGDIFKRNNDVPSPLVGHCQRKNSLDELLADPNNKEGADCINPKEEEK